VTPRVVVAGELALDVRPLLTGCEVSAGDLSRDETLAALARADALIALLTLRVDAELLAHAPRLGIVANHAVGTDNVDVAACSARGIAVTSTPGVLTEATADLTFALLLAAARRLGEGEALVRSGGWRGWQPGQLLGADVYGRTLGLIGFGRIGQAVAARAAGFQMRVLTTTRHASCAAGARRVELDQLLAEADFVSLHCPLTPETRGIIDAAALARMKPGAILVNTARGACVDEAALAAALQSGHLGAAGLDVFAEEPHIHPALLAAPRTVLLPHLGSATRSARGRMAELCAEAVTDYFAGRRPRHLVNPDAWPPSTPR